jgi:aspartate-semialdehyde dehydrogenase
VALAVDIPPEDPACTSGVPGGIADSMSPPSKTPLSKSASSQADLRGTNLYRVAIVGAASLKGKEIAEILRERNFPAVDVRLLDDDESLGQLEAAGDEMSFIQSIRSEQFERVDFAFFASDPRSTRNNWKAARDLGDTIVDLSYALEDEAGASVRSPWIERQTGQPIAPELQPGPVVVAHPAATVLALLALRSEKISGKAGKIQRVVATVFEPASENGQKGMDELHEQTVNLLSFQELPKNVFDIQVAFNMVPRYGQRSELALDAVSQRIRKHYRRIARGATEPALQVLQAPVFHGHGFSVYLEMEKPVAIADLSQALAGEHVVVNGSPEDTPTNVSAAGQGDILVAITNDANHKNGAWLWATTDNLRVAALTAVECAETMTASRPRGQIQ